MVKLLGLTKKKMRTIRKGKRNASFQWEKNDWQEMALNMLGVRKGQSRAQMVSPLFTGNSAVRLHERPGQACSYPVICYKIYDSGRGEF